MGASRHSRLGTAARWLRSAATHAVLLAGAAIVAFPFFWMIVTALKSDSETRGVLRLLPRGPITGWHWENYVEAWRAAPFATYFLNTLIVASLVTAGVLLSSLLAGYAFAHIRFAGKRVLFIVFLATMMVPFEVVLVPNFITVTWMKGTLVRGMVGLFGPGTEGAARTIGAFGALILPWSANVFSIFLVTQFFKQIPEDYFDAAVLDGCGHWQFLWRIGTPMVAPALVTAGLFTFLASWNALLWPLVINTPEEAPVIQVALSYMVREEQEGFNLLMAASTYTILPIVVLYLVAQRRFIEGVAGTGLKG